MSNTAMNELIAKLHESIAEGNKDAVYELTRDVAKWLCRVGPVFDEQASIDLMQRLRNKRHFKELRRLGDALLQCGIDDPTVMRLYAQGLLDTGALSPARLVLERMSDTLPTDHSEFAEVKGLLGRYHKQVFVNQDSSTAALAKRQLGAAVGYYLELYQSSPEHNLWHGVNAMALLHRAEQDGHHGLAYINSKDLANQVIRALNGAQKPDAWAQAMLAEASLALGDLESALLATNRFAESRKVEAFHLGSFERQLSELWQLDPTSEPGNLLFPVLHHAMLHKDGGELLVSKLHKVSDSAAGQLEKTLGTRAALDARWLNNLLDHGRAVARIGKNKFKGMGTGFYLPGEALHPSWAGKHLLLSNYHVISPNGQTGGIFWESVVATFQHTQAGFRLDGVLWSSPPSPYGMSRPDNRHLDVVVAELDADPDIQHRYPVSSRLPKVNIHNRQRVYIIGHPHGGELAFSVQDNQLLDHEIPLIHYFTPTDPGSSGSPVFDENLELIGIHRAGSFEAPLLNGKKNPRTKNTYPANEGVWVQSIREAIASDIAGELSGG